MGSATLPLTVSPATVRYFSSSAARAAADSFVKPVPATVIVVPDTCALPWSRSRPISPRYWLNRCSAPAEGSSRSPLLTTTWSATLAGPKAAAAASSKSFSSASLATVPVREMPRPSTLAETWRAWPGATVVVVAAPPAATVVVVVAIA